MMCLVLLGGVWEVGAYSEVENTYVHRLHTFLHTGSGLYNPLQHSRLVSRPHILYNISTTLYSLQLYSSSTVYNLYNIPLAPTDLGRDCVRVLARDRAGSGYVGGYRPARPVRGPRGVGW